MRYSSPVSVGISCHRPCRVHPSATHIKSLAASVTPRRYGSLDTLIGRLEYVRAKWHQRQTACQLGRHRCNINEVAEGNVVGPASLVKPLKGIALGQ